MRTNFDDLLRDKVNSLDNFIPPEVQWEPENSWIRISRVLGKGGTRVYLHYLVAASVAGLLYLSGSLSLVNLQDMVPFPQPNEKISLWIFFEPTASGFHIGCRVLMTSRHQRPNGVFPWRRTTNLSAATSITIDSPGNPNAEAGLNELFSRPHLSGFTRLTLLRSLF